MNVPFLLTGGGFKGFEHGQYRMASKEITTLANLWATMLQDAGVRIDRFAPANGNTKAIASKHYLQVTEDHFAKAAQNTVQQPAVLPRRGRAQPELASHKKIPVLQGFAAGCEVVQSGRVEDRGLEPLASSCRNTHVSREGGAKSGAVDRENGQKIPSGREIAESSPQATLASWADFSVPTMKIFEGAIT